LRRKRQGLALAQGVVRAARWAPQGLQRQLAGISLPTTLEIGLERATKFTARSCPSTARTEAGRGKAPLLQPERWRFRGGWRGVRSRVRHGDRSDCRSGRPRLRPRSQHGAADPSQGHSNRRQEAEAVSPCPQCPAAADHPPHITRNPATHQQQPAPAARDITRPFRRGACGPEA